MSGGFATGTGGGFGIGIGGAFHRNTHVEVEVTSHTLNEIYSDCEAAIAWAASRGFPVERGRISTYRRTLAELIAQPEKGWGDLNESSNQARIANALLEVRELVSIFRGLSLLEQEATTKGLKHYIKGPFSPTEEMSSTSSNRARNIGFELYLNSLFGFAGLMLTYDTNADLSFIHDGVRVYVEAKRPTNIDAAGKSIREAIKQLSGQLNADESPTTRAMIALDMTKVTNPHNRIMVVHSNDHLRSLMYHEDKRLINLLHPSWEATRHPKIVGIQLHYRILTNSHETGNLNTLRWIGHIPLVADPILDTIRVKLQSVIRRIC